jgi:uncharacterized membrane protein
MLEQFCEIGLRGYLFLGLERILFLWGLWGRLLMLLLPVVLTSVLIRVLFLTVAAVARACIAAATAAAALLVKRLIGAATVLVKLDFLQVPGGCFLGSKKS